MEMRIKWREVRMRYLMMNADLKSCLLYVLLNVINIIQLMSAQRSPWGENTESLAIPSTLSQGCTSGVEGKPGCSPVGNSHLWPRFKISLLIGLSVLSFNTSHSEEQETSKGGLSWVPPKPTQEKHRCVNDVLKPCSLQKATIKLGIQGGKVNFGRECAIPGKEPCDQQLNLCTWMRTMRPGSPVATGDTLKTAE